MWRAAAELRNVRSSKVVNSASAAERLCASRYAAHAALLYQRRWEKCLLLLVPLPPRMACTSCPRWCVAVLRASDSLVDAADGGRALANCAAATHRLQPYEYDALDAYGIDTATMRVHHLGALRAPAHRAPGFHVACVTLHRRPPRACPLQVTTRVRGPAACLHTSSARRRVAARLHRRSDTAAASAAASPPLTRPAGYTDKLNQAIAQLRTTQPDLAALPIDKLLQQLDKIADAKLRTAIRNSGGGYVNHIHFW